MVGGIRRIPDMTSQACTSQTHDCYSSACLHAHTKTSIVRSGCESHLECTASLICAAVVEQIRALPPKLLSKTSYVWPDMEEKLAS